jgi:hypothetical protein
MGKRERMGKKGSKYKERKGESRGRSWLWELGMGRANEWAREKEWEKYRK